MSENSLGQKDGLVSKFMNIARGDNKRQIVAGLAATGLAYAGLAATIYVDRSGATGSFMHSLFLSGMNSVPMHIVFAILTTAAGAGGITVYNRAQRGQQPAP